MEKGGDRDHAKEVETITKYLIEKYPICKKCKIAVVLGSGLGPFVEELKDPVVCPYEEIPYWKSSKVKGHSGKLTMGALKDAPNTYVMMM